MVSREFDNVYMVYVSSQTLARLLFTAAQHGGYLDPHYIQEILGVSLSSLNTPLLQTGNTPWKEPQGEYIINMKYVKINKTIQ